MNQNPTTHTANDIEACLLNVLFTFPEKQAYIFENADYTFFQNGVYADIFKTAKGFYEKNGIATNVDVFEANKSLNEPLIEVITKPLAYCSMTSHYCKKLYERRLQELI